MNTIKKFTFTHYSMIIKVMHQMYYFYEILTFSINSLIDIYIYIYII